MGLDGLQINLHHLFGQEPGPLAEIEATLHQRNHGLLHDALEHSLGSKRGDWDKFRSTYWKERAKQIESM